MIKVCPKCKTNDALSATGNAGSEIMTYECQNCGWTQKVKVTETPVK